MLNEILLGLKLPEPVVVHLPVVVIPPIVPVIATVGLLAHTDTLTGAITEVGIGVIVIFIVSRTRAQIPFAVEVKTKVDVPADISPELGM